MAPNPKKKSSIKKHHLDKKYKPWRKGKSENATSGASLKNQLRGKKRLLSKLIRDEGNDSGKKSSTREALEVKIKELEEQIQGKERVEKERSNAMKYHKYKFFDKKKLLRMKKKMEKQMEKARTESDKRLQKVTKEELNRISDELNYIQYFPNDQKYIALFSEGTKRVAYDPKTLNRKDMILSRIQKEYGISFGKYNTPSIFEKDSTIDDGTNKDHKHKQATNRNKNHSKNPRTRKASINKEKTENEKSIVEKDKTISDSRFNSEMFQNSSIIKQADIMEQILDDEEQSRVDSDSSDSDSDSDLQSYLNDAKAKVNRNDSESSESDNESSIHSSSKGNTARVNISRPNSPPGATYPINNDESSDSEDDFFATEEQQEVNDMFNQAQTASSLDVGARGDKSKGWATQRQLPGEFKKRRKRN